MCKTQNELILLIQNLSIYNERRDDCCDEDLPDVYPTVHLVLYNLETFDFNSGMY